MEWCQDETISAVAYDIFISGFNTFNTNTLRLWRSKPYFDSEGSDDDYGQEGEKDTSKDDFDPDNLENIIDKMQDAEYLTSIYYPGIPGLEHEENRLK